MPSLVDKISQSKNKIIWAIASIVFFIFVFSFFLTSILMYVSDNYAKERTQQVLNIAMTKSRQKDLSTTDADQQKLEEFYQESLNNINRYTVDTVFQIRLIIFSSLTALALLILLWSFIFYKQLKNKNRDLLQTQEKMQKSIDLKKLFISIINHDLKNPLLVQSFGVKELQETSQTKNSLIYLEKMTLANAMMMQMVDDAKLLSQLEDKKYEEEKKTIDLVNLLDRVVVGFRAMDHLSKNIKIDYKKPKSKYKFRSLPILSEVFSNIIDNAIKYGGTVIKIKIIKKDNSYLITLANNGEDIPDEYKESIFQRYTRMKKEGVEGTGLGLAIVQQVTQLHNGKVWVEDNRGGGVVFKIELPYAH